MEARELATNAASYTAMGALLGGVLQDGAYQDVPATQAELTAWVTSEQSPFSWFLDGPAPQQPLQAYFGVARDFFLIIDLSNMTIAAIDPGLSRAETDLNALLAK